MAGTVALFGRRRTARSLASGEPRAGNRAIAHCAPWLSVFALSVNRRWHKASKPEHETLDAGAQRRAARSNHLDEIIDNALMVATSLRIISSEADRAPPPGTGDAIAVVRGEMSFALASPKHGSAVAPAP